MLATTIDKYCYISVRKLPPFFDHRFRVVYSIVENVKEIGDIKHPAVRAVLQWLDTQTGLEIHHDGDLPARSGLGSSSAFTVGLIHAMRALDGRRIAHDALASEAIHVEQSVIGEPVGCQDQISAAIGGFNHVQFRSDGTYAVNPMILPRERLELLQNHCMLLFTGISRMSAEVAEVTISNLPSRTSEMRAMQQMVDAAVEVIGSPNGSLDDFGRLLHETWMLKRRLASCVSNPTVDDLYDTARRAGAIGGKLLGAGGGGFVLLFVHPEDRSRVREQLSAFVNVPFRFETSGSRIVLYQPDGW